MWSGILSLLVGWGVAAVSNPEEQVNILIGSDNRDSTYSTGNAFPLIGRPWGFNYWTIQSRTDDSSWYFNPNDKRFVGIRCTHQPSPWIGDYGDFLVSVHLGDWVEGFNTVAYNPKDAFFSPYYFNASLLAYSNSMGSTTVEFVPTQHGGIFRAHFPPNVPASNNEGSQTRNVVFTLRPDSDDLRQVDQYTLQGYTTHNSGGLPYPTKFKFYYQVRFNQPIANVLYRENYVVLIFDEQQQQSQDVMAFLSTSLISFDQAALAYKQEIANFSFDDLVAQAKAEWRSTLGVVNIDVSNFPAAQQDAQIKTFYSNLYRSSLFPRKLWEIDAGGNPIHYSPYDPNEAVHPGVLSTDSGFWDAYRTVYPQLSILRQQRLGEVIQGWVNAYNEGGWLPKWASPGYHAGMTGTMGDVALADAIIKNIPGFDVKSAYAAIRKDAFEVPQRDTNGQVGRYCLDAYMKFGYIPIDTTMSTGQPADQTVSRTQNYALSDFAIAQAALKLNFTDDANALLARSQSYQKLWDPASKFFRPRLSNGQLAPDFDQWAWGGEYTEGGPWQYRFYAPHDVEGLKTLYGGQSGLCTAIDKFMAQKPVFHMGGYNEEIHEMTEMALQGTNFGVPQGFFGQYEQDNQPVHHVLYVAIQAGCPSNAQYWIRQTCSKLYGPSYFSGDEDNGEMSSWYLLSAMGVYALVPGTPDYLLGSPLFRTVNVTLPGSKLLTINAVNNTQDNYYVRSVSWNGAVLSGLRIAYADLMKGGVLEFTMSPNPQSFH